MQTKKVALYLSIAAMAAAFIVGCSQGPWLEYSPEDGKFTVMMPGIPKVSTRDDSPNPMVIVTTTEHTVPAKWGRFGANYTVSASDISAASLDDGWQQAFLQGAKGGLNGEGFKLTSEKKVQMSGRDAWEYESSSSTTDSTIRILFDGNRIYALEVARKKGNKMAEEIEQFFGSFTIK